MNREEFVNKLIDFAKEQINYYENKIVEDEKYPSLQKCHKEELISAQEGLNHFLEIKQDLDKLEQLEKENQELEEHATELFDRCALLTLKVEQLEKENQKLKEKYKHRAELCNEFCKYTKQYEKAMDIIQEVVSLNSNKILETERNLLKLSQEEYELLKEVFESVGVDDD